MNEEQRMAEVEKFKNYFSYISRPGADKLLAWLEEAGFFTAPASTKYHTCCTIYRTAAAEINWKRRTLKDRA